MHFFIILFLCILLIPMSSRADEVCDRIQIMKDNAEFVAGIDVNGKAVKPADLRAEQPDFLNDPIIIPVTLDIAERYGLNLSTGLKLESTIKQIKVYPDGRVDYNDQDISKKVNEHCQIPKKNEEIPSEANGQQVSNPVGSGDKIEGKFPENGQDNPSYN